MFNRFKEKLSGFKEALSNKIAEKVSQAEKIAGKINGTPEADEKSGPQAEAIKAPSPASEKETARPPLVPQRSGAEEKPKSRFSFFEKAKSLIFEQEVILEEKDLEESMWALEMALLESDVALPVAEEIVREVKGDLVGRKKKIGADTGAIAEQSLRHALITLLSKNHLDFDEYVRSRDKPVKILFVGVNGTGKTTSIAKVARYLMDQEYSVVLRNRS